jgi:hypothetical protein
LLIADCWLTPCATGFNRQSKIGHQQFADLRNPKVPPLRRRWRSGFGRDDNGGKICGKREKGDLRLEIAFLQ